MRIVWLDGALADPGRAGLPIDDPAVRWGEGLFETMRAEGGRVALLERHLARLARSAATLGLTAIPGPEALRAAVRPRTAPRHARAACTGAPEAPLTVPCPRSGAAPSPCTCLLAHPGGVVVLQAVRQHCEAARTRRRHPVVAAGSRRCRGDGGAAAAAGADVRAGRAAAADAAVCLADPRQRGLQGQRVEDDALKAAGGGDVERGGDGCAARVGVRVHAAAREEHDGGVGAPARRGGGGRREERMPWAGCGSALRAGGAG